MIQQLQQIFHSITKSLEVLYVIEGAKPCARILVFENEIDKALIFFKKNKINYAISDFKVVKQNVQSEFYSDKSLKIPKSYRSEASGELKTDKINDFVVQKIPKEFSRNQGFLSNSVEKGYFFVYLSKNKNIAEKAKSTEEKNNHKELGLLFGYPKCCCEFFEKNFNEKNTDLTLKTLENSKGYEFLFYNNIAARHFDVALLSHFLHSFECKPSIEIAKNNLKIIQKYSAQLAVVFSGILQGVIIYTMDEGIFLLRKYEKINNEVIYGDVLTTTKNKLYFLISSNNKLKIIDKNNFVVSDVNIKGDKYGIMVFT